MIIFSLFLDVIIAQQIKPSNYAIQLEGFSQNISQDLQFMEKQIIQEYPGSILKNTINSNNTAYICKVTHESIQLTTNITKQIIKHDEELYTNVGDQIIGVVRQKSTLLFITETNNYIIFDLQSLEILGTFTINLKTSQQYQKGIYSIESDLTFLIYDSSIVTIDSNNNLQYQNVSPITVNEILSSFSHIYIATNTGLLIYKIDKEMNGVIFQQQINIDEFIVDICLGGENGEILYILKQDGIHIYKIEFDDQNIQFKKYSILPQITIEFGIAFEQHNDQSFVVLVKPQKHVSFVDIEVNLEKGQWFIVSQHNLKILAKDLDINSKFIVLQGVETHNILRHSLPNMYTKIFTFYPFTLPHTINLDFYEPDFNFDQSHTWYKNRTKNFLYGVDAYSIVIYNWENRNGQLVCEIDDEKYIGQTFNYQITTLTTECDEKDNYQTEIISKDLIACQFSTQLNLNAIENIQDYSQNILLIVIMALGGSLILSVLAFVCYRKNTQKQIHQYKQQIKKYEKFQGEGTGVRQNTPHPIVDSNFKIDEDDQ